MAVEEEVLKLLAEMEKKLTEEDASTMVLLFSVAANTGASEPTTSWTGMNLNIGSTVLSGIIAESSSIVATEMVTLARLSESADTLIGQVKTILVLKLMGTELAMYEVGKVSSFFSFLQSGTEAAELEKMSKWTVESALKLTEKIAMFIDEAAKVIDWLGTKLLSIIQVVLIDVTHPPPWAQSMSVSEKKDLKAVVGALPELRLLIQGWHAQWKTFSTSFTNSLGNIDATVGGRKVSVPALYVIYYAFSDMEEVSACVCVCALAIH